MFLTFYFTHTRYIKLYHSCSLFSQKKKLPFIVEAPNNFRKVVFDMFQSLGQLCYIVTN